MSPKRDLIERLEKLEGFDGYCTDCEGVTRIINGRCGCGHHWRIPRAIQIDDAVTEFEFPAPIAQKDRADD